MIGSTKRISFGRAIATVGGLTGLSRIAGFARDVVTAAVLGAGPGADAFFVALKLPNLFRRLFAEGAFGVAFVPLFTATLTREGPAAARAFAGRAMSVLIVTLVPVIIAAELAMPAVIAVIAPGFTHDPTRQIMAIHLARLTFPYLLPISLVALLGGALNAVGRFAPAAGAPVLFNLSLLAALATAAVLNLPPGPCLAISVALSGLAQLVLLAIAAHAAGLAILLPAPRLTPAVRHLFRIMAPAILGAGVVQLNTFINIVLASLLPPGAISVLYYADRLQQLPLGIVGVAIGTALLPVLARHVARGDHDQLRHDLSRGLEIGLLLALPAATALIAAGHPIVQVLFQRGAFGSDQTALTTAVLAAYAVGIPGFVLSRVLNTACYARQDTAGPVRVGAVVTAANAALGLLLLVPLGATGLALATGISGWLNAGLLVVHLRRRGLFNPDDRLRRRVFLILGANLGMALALLAVRRILDPALQGSGLTAFAALGGLVATGAAVYFALCHLSGAATLHDLRGLLDRPPTED
ncbi:MAG: murein biosynthesis integral membrane protein MurJ [Azospirillaceae bacterium]|nr:murein biosynthesis integral membrane protein MurJ [Azospirillaceae bacterium]